MLGALALMAACGLLAWGAARPVTPPPGVLAPEAPRQVLETGDVVPHRGYHLTPVARFEARVRVLGKRAYRSEPNARLAPFDLAVGWGPMSSSEVLAGLDIRQARRAYAWDRKAGAIATPDVIRNSTNIHLIPAGGGVERVLARLKPGHVVELRGRLVHVLGADGSRWRTSLSRTDAGVGACEILYLEALQIVEP